MLLTESKNTHFEIFEIHEYYFVRINFDCDLVLLKMANFATKKFNHYIF